MNRSEHNGLPWGWFSPGGNRELWGDGGTYQPVPYDALPPLPKRVGTDFAWLRVAPEPTDALSVIDADDAPSVEEFGPKIEVLTAAAHSLALAVPPLLRPFMTEPELHGRVPTCTACYIDLPARLVPLPGGIPGRLLRFMNDQQCCLIWYLHLLPGGGHQVVCGAPEFYDDATGATLEDICTPGDLTICASTFEDFVYRFWLENTLWYAIRLKRSLTDDERTYLETASASRSSR